jgi:hypothetical protein
MAGGELTFVRPDSDGGFKDTTLLRFDAHGQYISQASGLGGYLSVPFTYASGNNDSISSLGDIEVGGLFLPAGIRSSSFMLVLRGGLTLPTASDAFDKAIVGLAGTLTRLTDYYQVIPQGTSLRLGASPIFTSGNLFGRVDLGLDLNLDNSSDKSAHTFLRFNLGGGIWATPDVAITAELSTLTDLDGDNNADNNLANFALGARFRAGTVQPYIGLVLPLDNDVSDDIDFGFTVGVDAPLQ